MVCCLGTPHLRLREAVPAAGRAIDPGVHRGRAEDGVAPVAGAPRNSRARRRLVVLRLIEGALYCHGSPPRPRAAGWVETPGRQVSRPAPPRRQLYDCAAAPFAAGRPAGARITRARIE